MKKVILTVIVITAFLTSKAQQQSDSSETKDVPAPIGFMMKNNKPVGYNDDKYIFSLAEEFKSTKSTTINQDESKILKNFNSWWIYTCQNINLSQDFIALAPNSKPLSNKIFLQLLTTGDFYPVKITLTNDLPSYKLYSLDTSAKDIQNTIIQLASEKLFNYNMEGNKLPVYHFEDIAGNKYNNENTRGKIIVLKCWFIHCVPCVKEFPELNKLVDNYKNRKDILFVSLAFDNKQDLTNFLKTHKFNYAVVPNQQIFMTDTLNINTFPTHIVIGKDGKIKKAVNNYNDLLPALKKEALKE